MTEQVEEFDPTRNIMVTISNGEKCAWCKKIIPKKLKCVSVKFEIGLLVTSKTVTEYWHGRCAIEAGETLKMNGDAATS